MRLVIFQVTTGIKMAANEVLINDVNIAHAHLTKYEIANNATIKTKTSFALHYIAIQA